MTKTDLTDQKIDDFINTFVDDEQKKADTYRLIELLKKWSGAEPKIWGKSIIGFGIYHYKYSSGHEGDAPILAFSPRKTALTLYVYSNTEKSKTFLTQLGNFKMGKACIYVKKLSDINIDILKEICLETINYISENHVCACKLK
ncbi:MAG: DUF1801 domain-containing protein [Bacteroidales bacterium]|nr:DUF1801 domain-containing protein [Bacteroidales bacterium]